MTLTGPIILEGADGTGKSTLARELKRRFGGRCVHLRRHKDLFNWWFAALGKARRYRRGPGPTVIDRHWPSHLIYQSVYEGRVHLDLTVPTAHTMFTKLGGVYVFCVPDDIDSVVERHARLKEERVEMFHEGMDKVALAYHSLWEGNHQADSLIHSHAYDAIVADGGVKKWPNAVRYKVGVTTYDQLIIEIIAAQYRLHESRLPKA